MPDGEAQFSFKSFFIPFTSVKAIHMLIFIGFIVYGNALFGGFVWDDWSNILYNPQIKDINITRIFGPNELNTGIFYRPFYLLYLSFFYNIFTNQVFFYHFFQVGFHITNASMLFLIFNKFINKKIAFFIAVIFLVHPIQVESVSWISATLVPLSFLFGVTALFIVLHKKSNMAVYVSTYLLLLIAVFTRETGFFVLDTYFISSKILYKRANFTLYNC